VERVSDNARGVSVLADGSSIVTGMFQGTATFGSTTFTSAGNSDVFVAKLDASGDLRMGLSGRVERKMIMDMASPSLPTARPL
jgi:hypothetical protein